MLVYGVRMSNPGRETKTSIQVAVRLPKALHAALLARGASVSGQLVRFAQDAIAAEGKPTETLRP